MHVLYGAPGGWGVGACSTISGGCGYFATTTAAAVG